MKLHLGCGPIHLEGFVNVDHSDQWKPDVCRDVVEYLSSLEAESVQLIFTCHMLEHLIYPEGVTCFLFWCHYVLNYGGVLRIVVPDLTTIASAYAEGSDLKEELPFEDNPIFYKKCAAERFTHFMRGWEHTIVFDFELLRLLLLDAGFREINECDFGKSDTPELRDIDRFQSESIVVEAIK